VRVVRVVRKRRKLLMLRRVAVVRMTIRTHLWTRSLHFVPPDAVTAVADSLA
jgi:hypothetical protein